MGDESLVERGKGARPSPPLPPPAHPPRRLATRGQDAADSKAGGYPTPRPPGKTVLRQSSGGGELEVTLPRSLDPVNSYKKADTARCPGARVNSSVCPATCSSGAQGSRSFLPRPSGTFSHNGWSLYNERPRGSNRGLILSYQTRRASEITKTAEGVPTLNVAENLG